MTTPANGPFFDEAREALDWNKRKADLNERFLKILDHVFQHSRAYLEIYRAAGIARSDIRGLDDLEKLPVLRMEDLVARQKASPPFGRFETCPPEDIRRIYINPGLIFQPGHAGGETYRDTSWAEALRGAGFQAGDRIVNTFNYHMWPLAFMLDEAAEMIGATVIPTGVGNTLMQVRIMQALKANRFIGTPSFIMTLIQRAEGMGLDVRRDLSLETALVGAEMLPESLRDRIRKKLGVSVRQVYGTVFLGCLGYECPAEKGLHVPDGVVVEIVDPRTGRQVAPGAAGELVATCLNPVYPMIRMATGDLSRFAREPCACGRTAPMLERIMGRIDQATKVRGTFVHPWQADQVVSPYPEVFKYQVVITREDDRDVMTFFVEFKEETGRADRIRARIERDIKEVLGIKGRVRTVPRGTIPDGHRKIEDRRTWD